MARILNIAYERPTPSLLANVWTGDLQIAQPTQHSDPPPNRGSPWFRRAYEERGPRVGAIMEGANVMIEQERLTPLRLRKRRGRSPRYPKTSEGPLPHLSEGRLGSAATVRRRWEQSLAGPRRRVADPLTRPADAERQVRRQSGQPPEDLGNVRYRRPPTFAGQIRATATSLLLSLKSRPLNGSSRPIAPLP